MANWIFKVAEQNIYPDEFGNRYVFDNTHSTRVSAGDHFVYLDKRNRQYAFSGHGVVQRLRQRKPSPEETRTPRVRTVFTAQLKDVVLYEAPVDLRPQTLSGKENRNFLGLDNVLHWGPSVKLIDRGLYSAILDLVYATGSVQLGDPTLSEYEVPDSWSFARRRHAQAKFKRSVLDRQKSTCLVCGTRLDAVIDVAHIIPYTSDIKNRANPANGIALCAYCHRAFDKNIFEIAPNGHVSCLDQDPVARFHAENMSPTQRKVLMKGENAEFLTKRNSLIDNPDNINFI
jgi:hypothetical protein